jgi:acyl-CoA synthetase (AMP-forming)/AMP-acid ligase II
MATGIAAVATKYLDEQYFFVKDTTLLLGFTAFALKMKYHEFTNWTAADGLESAAEKWPGKEAIVFDEGVTYTFNEWNAKANQVARWAQSIGIKRGDIVAVMMENKPECLFTWTGLAKVGAVAALINNNLRGKPLLHCIKVCNAKALLFGVECYQAVKQIRTELTIPLYVQGVEVCSEDSTINSVDNAWKELSSAPVPKSLRAGTTYNDACMYIFTSGTTGLPKAAIVKHAKLDGAGTAFSLQFGIRHEDRIYNSGLPLYHSAANNVGGGVCLTTGATLVLRRKFSASMFWKEVAQFECTVVQYIGELCRYLLATPVSPYDKRHNCRLAVGNGLRPDIWEKFQTRFNIKEVGEFYGATEGNVALFNLARDKRARGAVGHMGIIFKQLGLCTLLRYDPETQEIVRDPKTGFCIECLPGEAGEAVAEMKGRAAGSFDGYLGDKEQSEKKLLRNVFRKGDCFFRTGDLLMRDKLGYYYFIDRMGDTFRWKGENVATTEVAEVVSSVPGVLEVTVYGVQIPGKDGRACCAAIVQKEGEDIDLQAMISVCETQLPAYARPLFVRILPKLATTGTFKHQKVELREEGMDIISKVKDKMYFMDEVKSMYVPLTSELYQTIVTGKARL